MSYDSEIQVGDWVRVQRGGVLVIAEVVYTREQDEYPRFDEVVTTEGTFPVKQVLEWRRKREEAR